MSRWSADLALSLRTCPVCSSDAVMASRIDDAGPDGLRCVLRCGSCETWRGARLPAPQGFALEYRLARTQRRRRRLLARDLRRLERSAQHLIGGPLEAIQAGAYGRLVTSPGASDAD